VVLLMAANGRVWHLTSFAIYGVSLILLYTASTLYHSLRVPPEKVEQLLVLDQVGIYLLIAGTYTPICLVTLRGPWGWSLFGVIWGIALAGITMRVAWRSCPGWVPVALYLVMGWLSVIAYPPLGHALPPAGVAWLFVGGMVYTVGCTIFALQRPRLWPGVFSSHELWHVFVLGGSACHFIVMLLFVARTP